jgi:hypothetical protein
MYNLEFFYISLTRDSRYATIVFDHKMDPSYNKNVDNYLQSMKSNLNVILEYYKNPYNRVE